MSELKENLASTYSPEAVECKWYKLWKGNGYFSADINKEGEPFSVVMPPPNVTGQLHMGHALDSTMQDILTRFRRMQGRHVLWLPGTDHAGIATQAKVEEALAKEGISKYDLGREAFLDKAWEWKHKYHGRIVGQLEKLGCSCDWDKERFTLDEGCNKAVNEVFVSLYKKGLIYRGSYIVNWCSHCQTTISDIEVDHNPRAGHLWYVKYPLKDGSGHIMVATSRPETIPGDTGVAVNPEDERYRDMVGKTLILPVSGKEIPIVADEYVDKEYGTGAVKITPAHDPNDFEMGIRHNMPVISVIGKDGIMNELAGKYAGMTTAECRRQIVADFEKMGLFDHIEDIEHAVGECYRCGTVVEPLVSPQWFVKMKPLAEPAMEAARTGDIRFVPERFTKVYLGWLENIRDWCISRQLWWGHRIPVWYCKDCGELICETEAPHTCPKCGSTKLEQDPDVLDTWFSSALWPFSTFGWPERTEDLQAFYPTSVLVTGRDIIFFWVARMIFMGLEFMKERPFKDVFLHGLVLDAQGRKMSKSLGNGIDPLEIVEKYGADTLRFMLVTGNTPGNDLRFQEERLEAARNFANKIWNASRFVLMNLNDYEEGKFVPQYELADKWILHRLGLTAASVTSNLDRYELGEAARAIYDFAWDEFCDWYVELAKNRLYNGNEQQRYTAQTVLIRVLRNTLQLLHPFMPFITEELWQHLPHEGETVMLAKYPVQSDFPSAEKEAAQMELVMDIIRALRNIRSEMGVAPGKKAEIVCITNAENVALLEEARAYILQLAQGSSLQLLTEGAAPEQAAAAHVKGVDIYMPLRGLIDFEKEAARLKKELDACAADYERLSAKLSNEGFLAKAPAAVVEKEKARLAEIGVKQQALLARQALIKG